MIPPCHSEDEFVTVQESFITAKLTYPQRPPPLDTP